MLNLIKSFFHKNRVLHIRVYTSTTKLDIRCVEIKQLTDRLDLIIKDKVEEDLFDDRLVYNRVYLYTVIIFANQYEICQPVLVQQIYER